MKYAQLPVYGACIIITMAFAGCSIDDYQQLVPCITDAQCPEPLACSDQGICVDPDRIPRGDQDTGSDTDDDTPGPCVDDDAFSPNRSSGTAGSLDAGVYEYLTLCPGGDDWYVIDLTDDNLYSVALYLRAVSPHVLGLGVKVYDEDMNFLMSASHNEDGDIIRWVCENGCQQYGGKIYVQVIPEAFILNYGSLNRYHFTVIKGINSDMCSVDQYEPDNMEITAYSIEEGLYMHTLCPNDIDYMKFRVPARQHVDARLVFSSTGEFEATLYDQDSGTALLSKPTADTVDLKLAAVSSTDRNLLLMVRPAENVPEGWYSYLLDLDLSYVPPATCRDDDLEPNDSIEFAAITMFPFMMYNMAMCPGSNDDYFMVSDVPAGSHISFVAQKIDAEASGEIRISVFDGTGTPVATGDWGGASSTVGVATPQSSGQINYYLLVEARNLVASGLGYEIQGYEQLLGN